MLLNAVIEKDEHGYFAVVPSLQGCMTQDDSYEEVLANIKEAIGLYLESLEADALDHLSNRNTAKGAEELLLQNRFILTKQKGHRLFLFPNRGHGII
ncbi:hypothetical protein NHP22001_13460 [Helicobacter sp. NHP22-001]|nr:hypothetical protein NHP22001_13460 [Helicobacter sp. NHP22-001]